jgi:two-component system sensor histidine kinase/response regulator
MDHPHSAFIELLPFPACILDRAGEVLQLNPAWGELAGPETLGNGTTGAKNLTQWICPQDRQAVSVGIQSAQPQSELHFDCRFHRPDGLNIDTRWYALHLKPLNHTSDREIRWLCIRTDIHERKQRELDLEHRVSIQTEMLDASIDCIKRIALDGTLIHMNKAGRHALGVPEDSSFGMPWLALLPADVRESGEQALASARAGMSVRFSGRSEIEGHQVKHWENMLTPVIDSEGKTTAILCVSREVTGEREAAALRRESEERLAIATRVGGMGIWEYHLHQDRLNCDATWYHIMGRDPNQPIRSINDFLPCVHPEDVERVIELNQTTRDLIESDHDYSIEFRIVHPNGSIRWVKSTVCLVQNEEGEADRTVGFVIDITSVKLAEQKLQKSHASLRQAEKLARIGNWSWDIQTDHAEWSETLYEIFGMDPTQPPPPLAELSKIFTPESFESFLKVVERCVTAGEPYSLELEGIRSDGSICFFNVKGTPDRNALGRIVEVHGTIADITERKIAENRIHALGERMRLATEAGDIGIWEMDSSTRRFLWDDQMHALYGLRPGEFGGTTEEWIGMMHPDDSDQTLKAWEKALRDQTPFSGEFRVCQPSGKIRYLRAQARFMKDPDGSLRAIGTNWDVTPAREAEAQLRAERQLLRTLVDHLPDVVFIIDREDRVQLTNPTLRRYLGMPDDCDAKGLRLHSFLPDGLREKRWKETLHIMDSGVPLLNHVEELAHPDGSRHWVRTTKIPWRDSSGKILGAIVYSANITGERLSQQKIQEQAQLLGEANTKLQEALSEAERQARRAQASERAKAEFLAVMSHEIRTPMNSVLGMVRLALQTPLSPKQQNYLSKIDLSAKTLVAIINDILDFSKIEAGGMTLESTEFSIEALLESLSAVTAVRAEEKGLELVFEVSSDVPKRVVGDSLRIGQVLINLVNNALKFTERGEVVVTILPEMTEDSGKVVLHFRVRDTGMGMSEEQMSRLFRPFTQADIDVSRKFGGTGLGLSISKRLVEKMGGEIRVESQPNLGSTFSFSIQVDLPQPVSVAEEQKLAGLRDRRVLIIDDNASARMILAQMMERFGVTVKTASTGNEGIDLLKQASDRGTPFEVVLLDWRMPGMDGLECARLVKSDLGLKQIPAILMVTAHAREEVMRQAEQLRLEGVLIKPITDSIMFNTLMEALGQTQALRSYVHAKKALDPDLLRGLRVLIADDDAINREILTELLNQLGLKSEAVEDGAAALQHLHEHPDFDYVLLDMEMSGLNGVDTARRIRQQPRFKDLPIIALTGHDGAEARCATREAGMDGHIVKPIHPAILRDELLRLRPSVPGRSMLIGRRVLIVDDNALNREVAGGFLAAVGMDTVCAASGAEALKHLETSDFDIVLMDVQMPEMDGLETTVAIRSQPRWSSLPIIALTAQAQSSDQEASLEAGMNAHLTKPIDETLLYQTIRGCLCSSPAPAVIPKLADPCPSSSSVDYPESLPGVDLKVAFLRLGQSQKSVLNCLRGFVRDFHSAPDQLDRDVATGNTRAVGMLAHTIKSVAAYLGAQGLVEAAAAVEQAEKDGQILHQPHHIEALQHHTKIVLDGISAFFAQSPPASPSVKRPGQVDHQRLLLLLSQMEPLIRMSSFDAVPLLEELCSALSGTSLAAKAETLREQFEELELEAAEKILHELRQQLILKEPSPHETSPSNSADRG